MKYYILWRDRNKKWRLMSLSTLKEYNKTIDSAKHIDKICGTHDFNKYFLPLGKMTKKEALEYQRDAK